MSFPLANSDRLRTLLILGRASNLPTVWSNCIAGWIAAGGGGWWNLMLLLLGATMLYTGGMFLNDAYDADFDRAHRPERPITRGTISPSEVWQWGFGWLLGGMVPLVLIGPVAAIIGAALVTLIVIYDAAHKIFSFSPLLMAGCRFLLFVLAGSSAQGGVNGVVIWGGLVLAAYVAGLSYVARRESTRTAYDCWPLVGLFLPVALAFLLNVGEYRNRAWIPLLLFCGWVAHCLRHLFLPERRGLGRTVAGLLAGMVLVDMLLVFPDAAGAGLIFPLLFFTALAFQRFVPAT